MTFYQLMWRNAGFLTKQVSTISGRCFCSFNRHEHAPITSAFKRFCSDTSIIERKRTDPQLQSFSNPIPLNNNERLDILNEVQKELVTDLVLGKTFAVVHIATTQFKVSINDIIMIHKRIEANVGDLIRLEKVLAVGVRNCTLVGAPLLKRDLVNVEAIVLEKTKGEKLQVFKKKPGRKNKKWNSHRQDLSVLKIKSIDVNPANL